MPRKFKKPTEAERLLHECPKCGARPTFPCTDFKGQAAPLCVERGKPDITARKLQKKADEKNAKALAELGGDNTLLTYLHEGADNLLAAEGVAKVTPEQLAAANQRGHKFKENSGHAEWELRHGLNWITLNFMRRIARERIGAEWEAKLWEKCVRTYSTNTEYILSTYGDCLCSTRRVELDWARHEEPCEKTQWNTSGIRIRLEVTAAWPPEGYTPVMTREKFRSLFELKGVFWTGPVKPLPEPDDRGLFERTVGALGRAAA